VDWFACFVGEKKQILKVLVLVKIWSFFKKKHTKPRIFATFFFDPTLFRVETDKLPQKLHWSCQMTKMLAKKKFHDILIRIGGGNLKC